MVQQAVVMVEVVPVLLVLVEDLLVFLMLKLQY